MPQRQQLDFTTSSKQRARQEITVDLVGQEITVNRPKDWTSWRIQTVASDAASKSERAGELTAFLQSLLSEQDWMVVQRRATERGDPLNYRALEAAVTGMQERWEDWDNAPTGTLVIGEYADEFAGMDTFTITQDEHTLTAHAPKDLPLLLVFGWTSDLRSHPKAMGTFLDAVFDPHDRLYIEDRLRDREDEFDMDEVLEIATALMSHWWPESMGNRQERRAAARSSGKTNGKTPAQRKQ